VRGCGASWLDVATSDGGDVDLCVSGTATLCTACQRLLNGASQSHQPEINATKLGNI